jgi:hypothetical protein
MASSSTSLELPDFGCVLGVSDGANGVPVDSVGNDFFASRNLALEPIRSFEVNKVTTIARWHRTSDPDDLAGIDRNANFIGEPRPIELW